MAYLTQTSNWRSKLACQLSIQKLLTMPGHATGESYLHTFTFADPEPTEREASKRWRSLRTGFLARHGIKLVWSMQRGGKTKRLHYHAVTSVRLDAGLMYAVGLRYGFGRYNVQPPKPIEFAFYVAKYVAKRGALAPGTRCWGVVGFKGVKSMNVDKASITLPRVAELPRWVLGAVLKASLNDDTFEKFKAFVEARFSQPLDDTPMKNALKPHQEKEVIKEVSDGGYAVLIGEYRGFTVRASKNVDKLSKIEVNRATVVHTVLCGTSTITVSDFLPPGQDVSAIRPAAESGEMVVIRCRKYGPGFGGKIEATGFIAPLTALPLVTQADAKPEVKK